MNSTSWTQAELGIALADCAEGVDWKAKADMAIEFLAHTGEEFTAYDVRAIAGPPAHADAMGARFLAARRSGLIVAVGYTTHSRPEAHSAPLRVWRGA